MCLAVMPPRKRSARSSSPMVPAPEAAAPEPTVDLTHLKILLELLIKSAASQQGIVTADASIEVIKTQLDAALAKKEEEGVGEDGEGGEEEEEEGEGEEDDDADGDDAMGGTTGAILSTQVMAKLDEIQAKVNTSKHEYGHAGNPSSVCGVCRAAWFEGCGWGVMKGNWACFACEVYICGFECLNKHNKGEEHGNKSNATIYTKAEYAELKEKQSKKK